MILSEYKKHERGLAKFHTVLFSAPLRDGKFYAFAENSGGQTCVHIQENHKQWILQVIQLQNARVSFYKL